MQNQTVNLKSAQINDLCCGFKLIEREYVKIKNADLYTLRHEKTGAELLYFDRADENKTFSVCFKTLPEDSTGVFHILEHSVLNGSDKYPVKEPFVTLLQSSMQTFLNAMTYSDKTVFPVSSRNEKDFFNLMSVYLDAVFSPAIYNKPEIFMQEGWHFKPDEKGKFYYNGVVYSEMKGCFADVDRLIDDETDKLLFPDNSYGFTSGGHPDNITDLTYEKFIETHKRFYHPTNAKFFLDGQMDIDKVLKHIDEEYLSKYDYKEPDFNFVLQIPKTCEHTVCYEARPGEKNMAHISVAKILCNHDETEKIYAAEILSDYLTGSNEAPLKRAFLEKGIAQDIDLRISDGVYQPTVSLVINNINKDKVKEIKSFLPEIVDSIKKQGLDKEALTACIERLAFANKEISEPYGVELCIKILDGWLYGEDPLTHVDNDEVFNSLHQKAETDYFSDLFAEILGNADSLSYLYVMPSLTKGEEDAQREADKIEKVTSNWGEAEYQDAIDKFMGMQEWQQSVDSEEVLATIPHLDISDVPLEIKFPKTEVSTVEGRDILKITTDTNGIVYLNMYFDISDFDLEELRLVSVLTSCFGELSTENYEAHKLQTKIKSYLGGLSAKIEVTAKRGDLKNCKTYLLVTAAMLKEKGAEATELLKELLIHSKYDDTDKIYEIALQNDYNLKQALVNNGHVVALTKALSPFSAKGAMLEYLDGESFTEWYSEFAENFEEKKDFYGQRLNELSKRAFSKNRLFMGYAGDYGYQLAESLIKDLPESEIGDPWKVFIEDRNAVAVEIPSGVGFSAMGHNLYALGSEFTGSCSVLSSLVSYAYLWNMIRVQGGAYGTGMNIRMNGDIFCYSYRDPNPENSRSAYSTIADFLAETVSRKMPIDDIIIGAVNSSNPILDPASICNSECRDYLNGITREDILKMRKQIIETDNRDFEELIELIRKFGQEGKFCVVGDKELTAFIDN